MSGEEGDPNAIKLSVIIPCYNGAKTIGAQLEALIRQQWSGPWEVILSDNGSTDETLAIVESYKEQLPNLRVVDASARRGQPYALNVGIRAATGEALLFCDADDEVGEGWLAAMAEALSEHDFVACRIDAKKLNEPWLAEGRGSSQDKGLFTLSFAPHLYFAGGGTIGVTRSLLLGTAGGFDESMPMQHDTMLCVQLQLAGKEIHFVPDAVLHIRLRNTLLAIFRQACGWAEYEPVLYKRSIELGVGEVCRPWRDAIGRWRSLLGALVRVRNRAMLAQCAFRFGWQLGLVRGSIKNRVLYL
jgi:glycosyltransferase involved in cell wall biosynthesis